LNDTGNKETVIEGILYNIKEIGSIKYFTQIKVSTSNAEEKVAKLNEIKNKAIGS